MLTLLKDMILKFNQEIDHRIWAPPIFPTRASGPYVRCFLGLSVGLSVGTSKGYGLSDPIQQPAPPLALWGYHPSCCSSRKLLPIPLSNQPHPIDSIHKSLNISLTAPPKP